MTAPAERFEMAIDVEHARTVVDFALDAMALPRSGAGLRVTRVFPSGEGLCIQYAAELPVEKRRSRVLLCGYLPAEDGEIPDWADHGTVFRMPGSGLLVPAFPYDPALPALQKLRARGEVDAWLQRCGVAPGAVVDVETAVLAYRLQKRCVLRYTLRMDDGSVARVITKVMRPRRARHAAAAWRALAGSPSSPRLPGLLATDEENGLLGMEFVTGRSMHDCIGDNAFADACAEAARLLNALHAGKGDAFPAHTAADEIVALDRFRTLLHGFYPAEAAAVAERIALLTARMPLSGRAGARVHRDFYDKQLILSPGGATMLDWEGVSCGDPAIDVGNFIAHLNLRGMQHPAARNGIEAGERRFRAAISDENGRTEWWRAASLTRIAVLYRLRPRWRHLFEAILAEADNAMTTGGMR